MPSVEHEALILLFRNLPELAADLLRDVLGAELPDFEEARVASAELTEVQPTTLRADLVVELCTAGRALAAIVVEVQLRADEKKRLTWPVYVASGRLEWGCPVMLLVMAPDEHVRRWAAEPIHLGHPGLVLTPFVLSPAEIPIIEDHALALHRPELAVLSSLAHAKQEENFELLLTALAAVAPIDEDLRATYTTILLNAAGEALRNRLEREMNLGSYPEPTDLEKRILARGEARGKAQGQAQGKAEAVLTVLRARGLHVSDAHRDRLLGCTDLERLDAWLVRALDVDDVDDLFASR